MNQYDLLIIGAGPGGYVAAIRAAQLGMKTAIVESRETLGGTCLNVGCIPSKALLDSSELYARVRDESTGHGITFSGLSFDLSRMMARKTAVVGKLTAGVEGLMKTNGVDVYRGTGRIVDTRTVEVSGHVRAGVADGVAPAGPAGAPSAGNPDGALWSGATPAQTLRGERLLLATGSAPVELPILPFDGKRIISSTQALELTTVPERLLIVGAGVIGLELGSVYARLGSRVTVVEVLPRILAGWDGGVAKLVYRELQTQGIEFRLSTKVTGARIERDGVTLLADPSPVDGDVVMVAVGRRPRLDTVNIEAIAPATERGRIVVDADYQTTVPGVYAIGDIVAGPMLAHKAEEEGIAVAERMAGIAGHVNYDIIPNVLYTWPEAASVGKSAEELKAEGRAYRTGTFPFAANGRALAMEATTGSVTILACEKTDRVLGAHIVGPWASDLIAEIAAVMEFGGSAEDIARTTHAHPTLSEAVKEAALGVDGRMIHGRNRQKRRIKR